MASVPGMFERIANLLKNESDVGELEKLIAERYRNDPADNGKNYWTAEVAWYRKDYATAAKSYSKYLEEPRIRAMDTPSNGMPRRNGFAHYCGARLSPKRNRPRRTRLPDARTPLRHRDSKRSPSGSERGMRELIAEQAYWAQTVYRDEDLGPLLPGKVSRSSAATSTAAGTEDNTRP